MATVLKRGPRPRLNYTLMNQLLGTKEHTLTEIANRCDCSIAAVHIFAKRPAAERRKLAKLSVK